MCNFDDFDEPEFFDDWDDMDDDFMDEAESDMDELLDEDLSPAEEVLRRFGDEDEATKVDLGEAIIFSSMIVGQALDEAEERHLIRKKKRRKK